MRQKLTQLKTFVSDWWTSLDTPIPPSQAGTGVSGLSMKASPQEYKRLLTQSAVFFGISGIIWLVFLFVLMPLMIRFAGNLNNMSLDGDKDDLPPRVPSFSIPQTATNSAEMKINGYGEPGATIILVLNGQQKAEVVANDDGEFTVEFNLNGGENTLAFFSRDAANNESTLSHETKITFDQSGPELTWDEPEDGKVVTNLREREVKVSGQTQENVRVYLNDSVVFVDSSGKFQDSFYLNEGENVLKLKVVDPAGNEVEQERKVSFRP